MKRIDLGFILLALVPLFLYGRVLFLSDPPILQDEAILFDTGVQLITHGQLKSDVYGQTMPRMDSHSFGYPPLYYWILAGWIKLIGTTLESGRLLSLFFGALFIGMWYAVVKKITQSSLVALVCSLLVSADFFIGGATRTIRMDIFTLFFLTATIYAYLSKNIFLAGVAAACALLSHPLGILAPTIVLINLYKNTPSWKKEIITFVVPVVCAAGIWIVTIAPAPHLFAELHIMLLEAKRVAPSSIVRMWSGSWIDQLFLVVSCIALSLTAYAARTTQYKHKRFVWIVTILTVSAVIVGKEQLYILLATPFIYLQLLLTHLHESKRIQKLSLFLLLALGLCNTLYNVTAIKASLRVPVDYYTYAESIYRAVPKGSWVLLAAHPDPYFYLRTKSDIHIMEFPFQIVSPNTYDAMFAQADYIVANMENDALSIYVRKHATQTTRIVSPNGVPIYIFRMR